VFPQPFSLLALLRTFLKNGLDLTACLSQLGTVDGAGRLASLPDNEAMFPQGQATRVSLIQ
jgi:hypothetical protein